MNYLHNHENHIIHGDIKAANILYDGSVIKLTDFGESRVLMNNEKNFGKTLKKGAELLDNPLALESGQRFGVITGSFLWMAPEAVHLEKVGRRSDIWSLGCTIIELASGNYPWAGIKDLADFFSRLQQKKLPEIPEHLSAECKDFIL